MQLSNEEKIAIISQHVKNLESTKYNLQLTLIEENSIGNPNSLVVSSLNKQIQDVETKITALDSEKTKLE